jgi:hypothetical protein
MGGRRLGVSVLVDTVSCGQPLRLGNRPADIVPLRPWPVRARVPRPWKLAAPIRKAILSALSARNEEALRLGCSVAAGTIPRHFRASAEEL